MKQVAKLSLSGSSIS